MSSAVDRAAAVTVTIARDPALVRTVRLVAAAVARRAGRDEEFVEEVRLAAGEACALFLGDPADDRGVGAGGDLSVERVAVTITIDDRLWVEVSTAGVVDVEDHPDSDLDGVEPWTLLRGLIDDFRVVRGSSRTTVSMSWPLG
jgi:hypothetical protein